MRPSSSPSDARRRCSRPVPLSSLLSASAIPPPSTAVRRPISSHRHHPTSIAPLAPHPSTTSSTTCRHPHLPLLRLRLHRGIQPTTSPWPSSASRCSHPIRLPPNSCHHPIRQISTSTTALAVTITISVGDKLPDAILAYFDLVEERQTVTVWELTKGKKIVPFTASSAPLLPPYGPLPPPHRSSRLRLRRRPGDPHPSLPLSLSLSNPPSLPSPSLPPCLPSRVPPVGTPTWPPPMPPQHRPPQALFPSSPNSSQKKQHRGKEKKKKRKKRKKKRKKEEKNSAKKKRGKERNFFPFFLMERNLWFRLRSTLVPCTTAASSGDAPPPPAASPSAALDLHSGAHHCRRCPSTAPHRRPFPSHSHHPQSPPSRRHHPPPPLPLRCLRRTTPRGSLPRRLCLPLDFFVDSASFFSHRSSSSIVKRATLVVGFTTGNRFFLLLGLFI